MRNRSLCPVCNEVVECHQLARGYEFEKRQYVQFTEAELEVLEAEANSNIELVEFIGNPESGSGLFRGARTTWRGEKSYRLHAMEEAARRQSI